MAVHMCRKHVMGRRANEAWRERCHITARLMVRRKWWVIESVVATVVL